MIIFTVMFVGCGKKPEESVSEKLAEKAIKEATGKDMNVDIQGNNIKIEGDGAKTELKQTTEWPSDMFDGVPKFTACKIEHVTKVQEGGNRNITVMFSDAQVNDVKNYESLLKDKGWKTQFVDMGNAMMITAQKDKLGLNLSCSNDDKKGALAVFTAE
jgi:hypothetical protein